MTPLQETERVVQLWRALNPGYSNFIASGLSLSDWAQEFEALAGLPAGQGATAMACLRTGILRMVGAPKSFPFSEMPQ